MPTRSQTAKTEPSFTLHICIAVDNVVVHWQHTSLVPKAEATSVCSPIPQLSNLIEAVAKSPASLQNPLVQVECAISLTLARAVASSCQQVFSTRPKFSSVVELVQPTFLMLLSQALTAQQ